jgi:hypothetical protein
MELKMPIVQVTIKDYLAKLQKAEKEKPEGSRRHVPTMVDVARESGIYMSSLF